MDIHSLISASVRNYQPRFEELLVEEWDRESPINDTPAAEILAALPDGHERAVLLRVGPLDITIYRQHVHPETGAPLKTDRDIELVKAYMMTKLIQRLLADDMQIKNAISAALAKRMFAGIEAEREAAGIPDPDLDLWATLHAIESGTVTVTLAEDPASQYCGNVEYQTSNGWTLVVFNDCDSWDYLDSAVSPDGRTWSYLSMSEKLQDYRPPDMVVQRAYRMEIA